MTTTDAELMDDIYAEAELGWIELSHAVAVVRLSDTSSDVRSLLRRAGPLVVSMVRSGRLVPGAAGRRPGTFEAWPFTPAESADRLARELEAIYERTSPIVPGEICYFAAEADPGIVWTAS